MTIRRVTRGIRVLVTVAGALFLIAVTAGIGPALAASTRKVVEITTPGGVKAWLVEEKSIPLVSIRFAFAGGALQDPDGREGLGGLLAALLTEGGGDLNAEVYARQLADQGTQLAVSLGREQIAGGFDTLKRRLDASAELLRIAVASPRFDAEAVERVRLQRIADLENTENEPRSVAFNRWYAETFRGNAYGLANTLRQTALFRPSCRSKKVKNLFYTGQLTVPGPGVPPSLISGEVVAKQVIKAYG